MYNTTCLSNINVRESADKLIDEQNRDAHVIIALTFKPLLLLRRLLVVNLG
jgi:hypothetical protein